MSLSKQIVEAVEIAKANLGDLVIAATLVHTTGSSYANGTRTPTTVDVPIQLVIDKLTEEDQQRESYKDTDLRVSVFNNETYDLEISTNDQVVLNGKTYSIEGLNPTYVGSVLPLFEMLLKV